MFSTERQRQTLYRITHQARQLERRLGTNVKPCKLQSTSVDHSSLPHLPRASPIVADLISKGLSPRISEKISDAYLRYASELRTQCEERMRISFPAWIQSKGDIDVKTEAKIVHETYTAHYTAILNRWIAQLIFRLKGEMAGTHSIVAPPSTINISSLQDKRTLFNQVKPPTHRRTRLLNHRIGGYTYTGEYFRRECLPYPS